jgi:hypothetical protein
MATLATIRDRILTKYQSLATQQEKLEFVYQVQERLRTVHNNRGQESRDGQITQEQWDSFVLQWRNVSEKVSERIATLRDVVFQNDYGLTPPTVGVEDGKYELWSAKREQLKSGTTYQSDIDTIWQ